jgi:ribosome-associated toxin RatA of RatAB toxin-antitoxin module
MRTVDKILIRAPLDRVFRAAADIERWPEILPHYRWVRFLDRRHDDAGTVEMAAWRPFGTMRYPTWWVSEMTVDRAKSEIRYRHLKGITRGMEVAWRFDSQADALESDGVLVTVIHEWRGPAWPLVGRLAASVVIGPVFIHEVAQRTLAGIKRELERATTDPGPPARGQPL